MKKFSHCFFVVIVVLLSFSSRIYAQNKDFSKGAAKELVIQNAGIIGLSDADVQNAIVTDAFENTFANTTMVYLQQAYKGVPIYNSIKTLAFRGGKVVSNAGAFYNKLAAITNTPTAQPAISSSVAVGAAAVNVDRTISQNIIPITPENGSRKIEFPSYGASQENITATLLWVPTTDGQLNLSWQVKFVPVNSSDYWLINVDAKTGTIISKDNLTVYERFDDKENHGTEASQNTEDEFSPAYRSGNSTSSITGGSYRVVSYPAESPSHAGGTPILVTNPWELAGVPNNATTLGWHNDGVADYEYTRGNNIWSREDRGANNGSPTPGNPANSTTASPTLTFDFPFNDVAAPTSIANQNFAITQLFYWTNIMHDVTYLYGFDEVSGNFQNSNSGRGGIGNDYVIGDAQDGNGTNNANFSTPQDGARPRMQMYLWNAAPTKMVRVNSPATIFGFKKASESNVSTANKLAAKGPITADVALYSTIAANNTGCVALTGTPLAGKIALLDQGGTCTFPVRIKNAQLAGALGVLVARNIAGNPYAMTGTDNTIIRPAAMITLADGQLIKSAMQDGAVVNVTMSSVNIDGDLDNGIIAHEFAHGISNRLTGGPSNSSCLINKEQMGEGWSDYFALMTTTNWATATVADGPVSRAIGTYAFGQEPTGSGIRNYPYTTNMTINPWTYSMLSTTTGGEVHNTGEIWSAALWDMTWNLIEMNGINTNFFNAGGTGGNSIAMKLVTEGMKLQSCRPGFLDGRDGILKADSLLYNGQYSCAIWKAFARRGMGVKAKQGSSDSYTDQTSDFTVPGAVVKKTVDKFIADQNEELTYNLQTSCKCESVANYKIVDTLETNVTYISGGTYDAVNRTVTFDVPSLTAGQTISQTLKVRVNVGTYTPAVEPLNESVPTNALPATFTAAATGTGTWTVSSTRSHSATYSYKAINSTVVSRQVLTSVMSYPINGISTLSFWHYYNTEASYDGGVVELSTNGTTWVDAGPFMYQNGYNDIVGSDSRRGFSGTSGGQFIQTLINLSSFKNKSVKIRFVFTTDPGEGGDGWYVDDITLKNQAGVFNVARLYNGSNGLEGVSDTSTLITANLPLVWGSFTAQKEGQSGLLKWTTLQEQNTAEFVVERSKNGQAFERIGTVRASGHTSAQTAYNYTDIAPLNGVNYYRIKQVDLDGRFTNSDTRSLVFDKAGKNISIAPNPAKDKIVITIPGNRKTLQVSIFTTKGEKVGAFIVNGEFNKVNLPGYPSGVYYVQISGEGLNTTQKLVVE